MPFGQPPKPTEAERVKAWKHKNPDKVLNQRRRKRERARAERRAQDPTGELDYGDVDGVDQPYPEKPEVPKVLEAPIGIEEPADFLEELKREEKRMTLQRLREEVSKIERKPYDPDKPSV